MRMYHKRPLSDSLDVVSGTAFGVELSWWQQDDLFCSNWGECDVT